MFGTHLRFKNVVIFVTWKNIGFNTKPKIIKIEQRLLEHAKS